MTGAAIGAVTGGIQGYQKNGWNGVLSGMGSGALNGASDGFMSGAICGAVSGAAKGVQAMKSTSTLMSGKPGLNATPKDCFVAGTKVLTEFGKKNIEDIKVGDKVWAYDEKTGNKSLKKITQLFHNQKRDIVEISINGETITTTSEHPFYVLGKGWVRAKKLLDNDILLQYNGEKARIENVKIEYRESSVQTYNFEVEDYHTYFVGESSVLCHNVCVVKQGNYRADVKLGGDPNHVVGHAHIYKGNSNIASISKSGNVLAGKLDKGGLNFVNNNLQKIANGINMFYNKR